MGFHNVYCLGLLEADECGGGGKVLSTRLGDGYHGEAAPVYHRHRTYV